MKVLVINTYGGSLLLGARALGCEIIGSYEDVGFGTPIQQANFPDVETIAMRKDWPTQDLSDVFVIAHPPCSAFSVQNNNPAARGIDSSAFACTKSVLEYAMSNGCRGLAIESVVGALGGAWKVHQQFADDYGYNLYRILENGTMFGAQWRDRFWSVYLKKGEAPDTMTWTLNPVFKTVQQVVDGYEDGPSPVGLDLMLEKLKGRFINEAGCTDEDMAYIFEQNHDTSVDGILWERKFKDQERWEVCKQYVTKYATSAMVFLDPNGYCPVLLGGSWWYMNGRSLSETAYKRLMGFPADYIFPEAGRYRQDMRTYLSKGVMPPIAEWILEQAGSHLGHKFAVNYPSTVEPYVIEIDPNHIADFRIRRKTWGQERPPLRHWDEVPNRVPREPRAPVEPKAPRPPREPRVPRVPKRQRSPWNAPELEEALAETLFTRPHTADKYALYESHGYHRMGVRGGDVVLDLGAHIGCVASRAALVGAAKIVSVEPEPENFALLQQNTRSFPSVESRWGAVYGGDAETVELHVVKKRNDGGHSTGTHSCTFETRGGTIPVPRLDFRALLNEVQPTVIKCDVEGGEFSLDWTNLPPSVRSIGIELHTRREANRPRAKEIVTQLEEQGFKPVHRLNMESNFSAIIAFLSREEQQPQEVR